MNVYLVGCGAQAKYAMENFSFHNDYNIKGIFRIDQHTEIDWLERYSVEVIETLDKLPDLQQEGIESALICCADNKVKKTMMEHVRSAGIKLVNAIHPSAVISQTVSLSDGIIINAGAVIQPFASVNSGSMIHSNAIIEHDCSLGQCVNIGPGAILAGWVNVGDNATIFTGANIIPKIRIGAGTVVAAGATVINNVPNDTMAIGVPAKIVPLK